MKERITQRLIENRDNIDFEPFQPKTYRPKQYRLRTRSDRIGKVGGLYGLYLYYCYRLGYLPKYKVGQQNHARVHYLFKEDLMKIDELGLLIAPSVKGGLPEILPSLMNVMSDPFHIS